MGTIIFICCVILFAYKILQRRRRESPQRRLETDDSNSLEYNLHHLRVPPELLTRLPIFVYPFLNDVGPYEHHGIGLEAGNEHTIKSEEEFHKRKSIQGPEEKQKLQQNSPWREGDVLVPEQSPKTNDARTGTLLAPPAMHENLPLETGPGIPCAGQLKRLRHSQTTCAICLDDFVPAASTVRELPCGHIFHPQCIDVSLTQTSSLCPLCKKCVVAPELLLCAPEAVIQQYGTREV